MLLLKEDILYVVFLLQNLTYEPCEVVTVLFDFTFELSFFVFFFSSCGLIKSCSAKRKALVSNQSFIQETELNQLMIYKRFQVMTYEDLSVLSAHTEAND